MSFPPTQMLPYYRSMEAFSHFDFSLYNEIDSSKKTTSNICSLRKKCYLWRIKNHKIIHL